MRYTVILRRSPHLLEVFDEEEAEFYVSNPETDFEDLDAAVKAARIEAATADSPEYKHILNGQGVRVVGTVSITPDNYEVIMAIEGSHKIVFGWQPELARYR